MSTDTPRTFWDTDNPSNAEEALQLLRFGQIQPDYESHNVDAYARTERRMLNAADVLERELSAQWQPIETAPKDGTEMFVVRAFNVCNGFTGAIPYTSDPWCVWVDEVGMFERWPHRFPPTHWMPLPPPPKA